MTERVEFVSDGLKIEGLFQRAAGRRGAVITHPHPQYGGDMHNPVVDTIACVYHSKGVNTLRFNFRGVGASEGGYGEGREEQQDVLNAIQWLQAQGIERIDLAGYSFGAWVNSQIVLDLLPPGNMIMVSPPLAFVSFNSQFYNPSLKLVVCGSNDEIAPLFKIKKMLPNWNPDAILVEIEGGDHFYSGLLKKLEFSLNKHIS